MKDDLRLMGIATRIFHGRPTDREDAEAIRQATTRFTDRIEALEAENERLREALGNIANESSDTWAREKARAALAGDSHDQ